MRVPKFAIILIGIIVVIVLLGCVILYMFTNGNTSKENVAKQAAVEYISKTYPNFEISDLDVVHDWKPNMYVVTCRDTSGNVRKVTFDHTGKKLAVDNYIEETSSQIIYDYTNSIKTALETKISNQVVPVYYVNVDLYKNADEKRGIVIDGNSIYNDPVNCTIGFNYNGILSKDQFVDLILQSVRIIKDSDVKIKTLKFVSQNSSQDRYDFEWDDTMLSMSPEELVQFIK